MATDKKKSDDLQVKRYRYKSRISYLHGAKHKNDKYKNLGYDYKGNILKNTTSSEIWANPLQTPLYGQLESLLTFIVEQVKMIKKTFSIAHDKDSLKI